jgi:hypothetical protein
MRDIAEDRAGVGDVGERVADSLTAAAKSLRDCSEARRRRKGSGTSTATGVGTARICPIPGYYGRDGANGDTRGTERSPLVGPDGKTNLDVLNPGEYQA